MRVRKRKTLHEENVPHRTRLIFCSTFLSRKKWKKLTTVRKAIEEFSF
jgi:hypothetical protein